MLNSDLPVTDGVASIELRAASSLAGYTAEIIVSGRTIAAVLQVGSDPTVATIAAQVDAVLIGERYELTVIDLNGERLRAARGEIIEALSGDGLADLVLAADVPEPEPATEPGEPGDHQYVHVQDAPSETWVITHGLARYPPVAVVDSALSEVIGDITYIDENTIRLDFSAAFGGRAFVGG